MKHSSQKKGAPIGNSNRRVHGMRDARHRQLATERGAFYRWCRETIAQMERSLGYTSLIEEGLEA